MSGARWVLPDVLARVGIAACQRVRSCRHKNHVARGFPPAVSRAGQAWPCVGHVRWVPSSLRVIRPNKPPCAIAPKAHVHQRCTSKHAPTSNALRANTALWACPHFSTQGPFQHHDVRSKPHAAGALFTSTLPPSHVSCSPLQFPARSLPLTVTTALLWLASTPYDSLPRSVQPATVTLQLAPTHTPEPTFAPVDVQSCTQAAARTLACTLASFVHRVHPCKLSTHATGGLVTRAGAHAGGGGVQTWRRGVAHRECHSCAVADVEARLLHAGHRARLRAHLAAAPHVQAVQAAGHGAALERGVCTVPHIHANACKGAIAGGEVGGGALHQQRVARVVRRVAEACRARRTVLFPHTPQLAQPPHRLRSTRSAALTHVQSIVA